LCAWRHRSTVIIARGAGGFTAVVQAVEFVRREGGAKQVALDLVSPEDPASEPAWLAALSALTELELELVANGMGGTRAVG
jgi:hypothetical protein